MNRLLAPFALLSLLAITGCKPIGVSRPGYTQVYERLTSNVLNKRGLSPECRATLHSHELAKAFVDDPLDTIVRLHHETARDPWAESLYALSEVSFHQARSRKDRKLYLLSAIYAYLYLFADNVPDPPHAFDRRFRTACDIYNRGLAHAMLNDDREVVPRDGPIELLVGSIEMEWTRPGFPWGPELFDRFLPCDEFEAYGLSRRVRDSGLGVPLIALATPEANDIAPFMVPQPEMPATAFLRVGGGIADFERGLRGDVELYAPFDVPSVAVGDRSIPLETDLTTPLAFRAGRQKVLLLEIASFFKGEAPLPEGVYLTQPYQAGKIPIVLVHGTASSPIRWAEMFNTLRADPVLRQRCQFWFFTYSSGNPISYSAALLREALGDIRTTLDPDGSDPMLDEMVVIGHSQGGLLTKMQSVEFTEDTWEQLVDTPLAELDVTAEERELIDRIALFEPQPSVRRLVFIATPHRGSYVAGNWIGNFFKRFVEPRQTIKGVVTKLRGQGVLPGDIADDIPTSVDNMDPDNKFLRILVETPIDERVAYHSIIAVNDPDVPVEEGVDGVVAYESAYVDGAESTFVVESSHSCQENSRVINEVRRILREHLAVIHGAPAPQEAGMP